MTTYASETWTGTAGAAWPSQWSAGTVDTGGSAKIATGGVGGTLAQTTLNYKTVREYAGTAQGDQELYVEVTIPSLNEHYIDIAVRCTKDTSNYYFTGYGITISPNAAGWSQLAGYGTGTYGAQSVTYTFTAGHKYGVRINVTGYLVQSRLWDITAGVTEPTNWQASWTDTDAGSPTGMVSLALHSGKTVTAAPTFTNLTWTDGAAAPAYKGALTSSGSGTATMVGTPAFTAPLSASGAGTGKLTGAAAIAAPLVGSGTGQTALKGAPGFTSTLTNNGTGSSTLAGSPNITAPVTSSGLGSSTLVGTPQAAPELTSSGTGTSTLTGSANFAAPVTATGSGDASLVGAPDITDPLLTDGSGTSVLVGRPDVVAPLLASGEGTSFLVAEGENTGAFFTSGTGATVLAGHADIVAPVTASGGGVAILHGTPAVMAALVTSGFGTSVLVGHAAVSQPAHTYTAALDGGWHAAVSGSRRTSALASNGWETVIHA